MTQDVSSFSPLQNLMSGCLHTPICRLISAGLDQGQASTLVPPAQTCSLKCAFGRRVQHQPGAWLLCVALVLHPGLWWRGGHRQPQVQELSFLWPCSSELASSCSTSGVHVALQHHASADVAQELLPQQALLALLAGELAP